MVTPELSQYVEKSLARSTPKQVREALVAAGWDPGDVDAAIALATQWATLAPKRKLGTLPALLILLLAVAGGSGAYAFYKRHQTSSQASTGAVATTTPTPVATATHTPLPASPTPGLGVTVTPTAIPSPAPSPSLSPGVLIPGWQVRTTTLAVPAFTLNYPPDWTTTSDRATSTGDEIDFGIQGPEATQFVNVSIYGPTSGAATYAKKKDGSFLTATATRHVVKLNSATMLTVDGNPAVENDYDITLVDDNHYLTTDILVNGTTDIQFGFAKQASALGFEQNKQVLEQVVSSIRFTH